MHFVNYLFYYFLSQIYPKHILMRLPYPVPMLYFLKDFHMLGSMLMNKDSLSDVLLRNDESFGSTKYSTTTSFEDAEENSGITASD